MENRITIITTDRLLEHVDAFGNATGLSETTISDKAIGDHRVFAKLRADGGTITIRRYNLAVQWLADNWPDEATIPDDLAVLRRVPASATPGDVGREAVTQ